MTQAAARKIRSEADSGKLIPAREAERRPITTVLETNKPVKKWVVTEAAREEQRE